ncbi:hypothetical protein ACFL6E_06555 [Candidatus Neomarinimicrobiota bacterium]
MKKINVILLAVLVLIQSMAAAPSLKSTANTDTDKDVGPNSTHITCVSNLERSALSAELRSPITNEVSSALRDTSGMSSECLCSHCSHTGFKHRKIWISASAIVLLFGVTAAVRYNS